MNLTEYENLYRSEERMWWFRALRLFLAKFLPKTTFEEGKVALDIGCGTGGLLASLSSFGYMAIGLDFSSKALQYARRRTEQSLVRGSANELPLVGGFDLVTCIDVLEVESVDPEQLVTNALRILKPGGYGLFVAAAHQWLLSDHDRAVNSVRRYSLARFIQLFEDLDIQIIRATYLFFALFPFIALRKLLNPKRVGAARAVSDVSVPSALVNESLFFICWLEAQILPLFKMPTGTSVLILVQKHS